MNTAIRLAAVLAFVYVSVQNITLNEQVKRLERQFDQAAWRADSLHIQLDTTKKLCRIE